MSYPRKTQSRIWATSIVYKHVLLKASLPYLKQSVTSTDDLSAFFHDDSIFTQGKGDLSHFIKIYNSVSANYDTLSNLITQTIDQRSLSCLSKSCLLCALSEVTYLTEPSDIILGEYSKLLDLYSEDRSLIGKFLTQN